MIIMGSIMMFISNHYHQYASFDYFHVSSTSSWSASYCWFVWTDYILYYYDEELVHILVLCLKALGSVAIVAATLIHLEERLTSAPTNRTTSATRGVGGGSSRNIPRRGSNSSSSSIREAGSSMTSNASNNSKYKMGGGGSIGYYDCSATVGSPFLLSSSLLHHNDAVSISARRGRHSNMSSSSRRQPYQSQRTRSLSPKSLLSSSRDASPVSNPNNHSSQQNLNSIEEKELEDEWDYWWHELDSKTKYYALILGYTQYTWDNDYELEDLPCEDWDWEEMTSEQKAAAQYFGCTEDNWEEEDSVS